MITKKLIISILAALIIILGSYFLFFRNTTPPMIGFWKSERRLVLNPTTNSWDDDNSAVAQFTEFQDAGDRCPQSDKNFPVVVMIPSNGCYSVKGGVLEFNARPGLGTVNMDWEMFENRLTLTTHYIDQNGKETSRYRSVNVPSTREEASKADREMWTP